MVSPSQAVNTPNAITPANSSERENFCILPPKGMVRMELRNCVLFPVVLLVGHLHSCCGCFVPRHLLAAGCPARMSRRRAGEDDQRSVARPRTSGVIQRGTGATYDCIENRSRRTVHDA